MKKYFIIAASALVAMCACTKNEVAEAPQQEINFAVANYAGQTKAAYPTTVSFGTYAWYTNETDGASSQEFMYDEEVSYDETSSTWKPSLTYYWPKSGTVDFISYSPKNISGSVTVDQSYILFTSYNVEHESEVDVMYADKAIGCTKVLNENNGVDTKFRHALSKINIKIKTKFDEMGEESDKTSWDVYITKLSVKNYFQTGNVQFDLDGTSWKLPTDQVWTNNETATEVQEFDISGASDEGKIISTETKDFVTDYYMLPQLLEDQVIYVEAKIVTTLPNGKEITEENVPMSLKFKTDNVDRWAINKNITYTLVINPAGDGPDDPKAIFFVPTVEDWDSTISETLTPKDE